MAYRGYGRTDSNTGISLSSLSETITTSSAVTAVEATVRVSKLDLVGCAANPDVAFVVAQVAGGFFNTATPIPGSRENDVSAVIEIGRLSNSTDPPNVLRVSALVVQCTDASCATPTFLGFQDLGPITKGTSVRLRVRWDPANDRFIFRRGSNPEVFLPYTVPDTTPPGASEKGLVAGSFFPNCTAVPRPVGFIDATFDNVFVNESAAP